MPQCSNLFTFSDQNVEKSVKLDRVFGLFEDSVAFLHIIVWVCFIPNINTLITEDNSPTYVNKK